MSSKAIIKYPTIHPARRYTTLWNINVRKILTTWTCTMINDTSQRSVAMRFRCGGTFDHYFIMAALRSRCGHYIFALWFLYNLLSSFLFLAESQRPQIGCVPYFDTWCDPSVNLECRSELCCKWFAGNSGPKKSPKSRHLGTITHICRAISSQRRHVSTIGKNC